jgi:hypothetical protein
LAKAALAVSAIAVLIRIPAQSAIFLVATIAFSLSLLRHRGLTGRAARPGRKAHLRLSHMDLVNILSLGCNQRHRYARIIRKFLRDLCSEVRSAKLDPFFHGFSPVGEKHRGSINQQVFRPL